MSDTFLTGLKTFQGARNEHAVMQCLSRIQAHDARLFEHSLLAGAIASVFAYSAGLSEDDARLLVIGTLLHDVGKTRISPDLLHKPGQLTQDERRTMEQHPQMGAAMLKADAWPAEVVDMVLLHHERLDGSGYPHGIAASQIGMLVRMVSVCDVFAALIEDRSYRPRSERPLEIMQVMSDEIDSGLLQQFSGAVAAMAYRAQRFLRLENALQMLRPAALPTR